MSWDVMLIKTETNAESIDKIIDTIDINKQELIDAINKACEFVNYHITFDLSDITWLRLESDSFTIEFNVGENKMCQPMLHIRGSEPTLILKIISDELECRVLDISGNSFMDFVNETSFRSWNKWKDSVQ